LSIGQSRDHRGVACPDRHSKRCGGGEILQAALPLAAIGGDSRTDRGEAPLTQRKFEKISRRAVTIRVIQRASAAFPRFAPCPRWINMLISPRFLGSVI